MKKNLSDYLVALSVIACSIVLLAALTFALSGYRLKKPARTLQLQYEQITAAAGPLFENANKLLDNLNITVTDLHGDLGEFMPKLGPLADSLKIDVDNLQNVIKNLESVSKDADKLFGTADTFISTTDKSLQEQMKELHVILLNLKVVTTHAKTLVESLAEKPNRVIFSGKAPKLTPEDEIIKSSKPLPGKKP